MLSESTFSLRTRRPESVDVAITLLAEVGALRREPVASVAAMTSVPS